MTSTPQHHQPQNQQSDDASAADTGGTPAGAGARKLQDDPRAQLALAKKNHAASPAAANGTGHAKAAHESSKQGKKEKKVRW